MRIKVIRRPAISEVDGVDERWAVPCDEEGTSIVPFSDADPFETRVANGHTPPNVIP